MECRDGEASKTSFRQQVKTNKNGKFRVILPFSIAKHVKKIESCSVKLIRSSEPFCSVASSATSSVLRFKSKNKRGTRIFSAGFFTFTPLEQPSLCSQKPTILKSPKTPNGIGSIESVLPPLDSPVLPSPVLPTIPDLPPLPPLIPGLPPPDGMIGDRKSNPQFLFPPLIPNPLQPPAPIIPNPLQPPAPVIPNPFQPPPAPIIPNPFQPPPTPFLPNPFQPLPPIPFFTPPPSPPPPSLLPPFLPPLPAIPGIPSGPPRKETSSTSKLQSP